MNKRRQVWIPSILITLFSLPIIQPLARSQFTCGFDNTFHLWRAVQQADLLRQGIWFSRWAPHMAHGFGYPLYQFQSPLSAYLAAFLNILGVSWPLAINLTYAGGMLGSGIAVWWLARDFWEDRGGMVAAAAMMYTPYHLYIVFYRASLSETVAWMFPPLILWGIYRWQVQRQGIGLLTAVGCTALLFYTHDVTGYIFTPLFLIWPLGLSYAFTHQEDNQPASFRAAAPAHFFFKTAGRGVTAVLLGLASGAFFWLPAIVERSTIQFGRAGSAWPFLPENNFLPLNELLPLPRNADPLLLNDWPERGLGALVFLLALLAIGVGLRHPGTRRRLTAVFTLFLVAYLFLVTPVSKPLWDNIGVLAAFQFPWRFLSPVVLMAALLIGGLGCSEEGLGQPMSAVQKRGGLAENQRSSASLVSASLLFVLILFHFGWLTPAYCDPPQDISIAGMVNWEKDTGTLGTTASRELLPTTVEQLPQENSAVPPWQSRFSPLPEGTILRITQQTPLSAAAELEAEEPFTIVYQAFDFPGWIAEINQQKVDITPSEPHGLMTFPVPSGRSTIRVYRLPTRVQSISLVLTGIAVGAAVVIALLRSNPHKILASPQSEFPAVHFALLALMLLGLNQTDIFRQSHLEEGQLNRVDTRTSLTFGTPENPAQVQLLGYQALPTAVPADSPLIVTLYWQALTPLDEEYRVGLTLWDENGVRWSDDGLRDYRWRRAAPPTTTWLPGDYVETSFFVDPLPGTPPGTYSLRLTFFEAAALSPLTIYEDGQPLGPAETLGQLELTPPTRPLSPSDLDRDMPLASSGDLVLWRAFLDREQGTPGDVALFTLFWQSAVAPPVELQLLNEAQTAVATYPINLTAPDGAIWRHQQLVRFPAALEDGTHQWRIRLPNGDSHIIGAIAIQAPERLFEPPPIKHMLNETLGRVVTLVGANVPSEAAQGETMTVELIWQAVAEMDTSYRVFVHLLNDNGQIIAQSDGLPVSWTRPTTGWQVGEYILDRHILTLPESILPGSYTLITGFYTAENGRLLTSFQSDFIKLPIVQIEQNGE